MNAEIAAATTDDSPSDAADPQPPPSLSTPPLDSLLPPDVDFSNPAFADLKRVFDRFNAPPSPPPTPDASPSAPTSARPPSPDSDDDPSDQPGLSRRALKAAIRPTVAALKQWTATPHVVEPHDVNSPDPHLLIHLKATANTVPVPQHWQAKKRYLSSKRGYEKLPFQLPAFIAQTGINKMRGVQLDKEAEKKSKAKQRDKMRPRMGAIDIDYQVLHDAFFRFQTKPPLTPLGALYYEGREFEVKLTEKRPLLYSQPLLDALGMASPAAPPPWLYAMQRHGPPPSYPFLRVPGVNAPLPPGGRWGMGEGEWGKPPIDESGRPRWGGDLFGPPQAPTSEVRIDGRHWGEPVTDSEPSDDEDEEPSSPTGDGESPPGSPSHQSGVESVSTLGLQTPSTLNLRKADGRGTETPTTVHPTAATAALPGPLYRVLETKEVERGAGLLGTTHTYVIPNVDDEGGGGAKKGGGVEVALGVEELEGLSGAVLKRKYEEATETDDGDDEGGGGGGAGAGDAPLAQKGKKRRTKEKEKEKFKF